MLFYQALRNCKAQPGAFRSAIGSGAHLIELVKNCLVLIFRNANSCVRNGDFREAVSRRGFDADLPALRCEFYRVSQQVVQNLLEAATIPITGVEIEISVRISSDFVVARRQTDENASSITGPMWNA